MAPFEAEAGPFLDLVFNIHIRVFCEPSSTDRYVASSLFFFVDFLPLEFLKGMVCRLLEESPSSVSSPGSVSRSSGSSFVPLEGSEWSTTFKTLGSEWGNSPGSNGSANWDFASLLQVCFLVGISSTLIDAGYFPVGTLILYGSFAF